MIKAIFTDIEGQILEHIKGYDEVIIVSAWFSSDKIANAIEGLSSARLIVSDQAKLSSSQMTLFDEVYIYSDNEGMLHSKYIVFLIEGEAKAVWTGSYNFTVQAQLNQENGVMINDEKIAGQYAKNAKELIERSKLVAKRQIGY